MITIFCRNDLAAQSGQCLNELQEEKIRASSCVIAKKYKLYFSLFNLYLFISKFTAILADNMLES